MSVSNSGYVVSFCDEILFRYEDKPTHNQIIADAENNGIDLEEMAGEGVLEISKICETLEIVPRKNVILRKFK